MSNEIIVNLQLSIVFTILTTSTQRYRLTIVTDASGKTTTSTYDNLGPQTGPLDPLGRRTTTGRSAR